MMQMISYNWNKKYILGILLVLTSLMILILVLLKFNIRYHKFIIKEAKWNSIIKDKKSSTIISLENIKFNDYNLLIDQENNTIYYSIVNSKNKYNPSIKYKANKKVNLVINKEITDDLLEDNNSIKLMIYNKNEYRIYTLVATNDPILNINYNENTINKTKISMELELFDNHVSSYQRVLKSSGKLRIIEENKEYSISLTKESLGHNKRENYISIFGMEKRDEYIIKKVNNKTSDDRYVRLFINNKYNGLYSFGPKEGGIDNFERNRKINK